MTYPWQKFRVIETSFAADAAIGEYRSGLNIRLRMGRRGILERMVTDPIATGKALQAAGSTALAALPDSVRKDLVGLLGGDYIHEQRARNVDRLTRRTKEIIDSRNARTETPSASIAEPIIQAAQDESRETIAELFAKLLAAALDPSRKNWVRVEFVDLVKSLDPLDAVILEYVHRNTLYPMADNTDFHQFLADKVGRSKVEVDVSLHSLAALNLVLEGAAPPLHLLPRGQLFMLAISD